jgi:putative ABC transport system ATP-binding protein
MTSNPAIFEKAMVTEPTLILADEPTANLDSATAAALLAVMAQPNRAHGTTFVFSIHDPQVMERARRLIRLRDGQIASDAAHAGLTRSRPESGSHLAKHLELQQP